MESDNLSSATNLMNMQNVLGTAGAVAALSVGILAASYISPPRKGSDLTHTIALSPSVSFSSSAVARKIFSDCTYISNWKANEQADSIGIHSLSHLRIDHYIDQLSRFEPVFGNYYALKSGSRGFSATETNDFLYGYPLSSLFTFYDGSGRKSSQQQVSAVSAAWQLPNRRQLRDEAFANPIFRECHIALYFDMTSLYQFLNHPSIP